MNYRINYTNVVTGLRHFDQNNFTPLATPIKTTAHAIIFQRDTRELLVPDMVMTKESCKESSWIEVMTSRPLGIAVMGYPRYFVRSALEWDGREVGEVFVDALFDKWDNDRETFLKMFPLTEERVAKETGVSEACTL